MKKKRIPLIFCAALLLALTAGGLWYTRPVSIAQLAPELDRDRPAQFHVWVQIWHDNGNTEDLSLSLNDGDPLYDELRAMLDEVRVKRTIEAALEDLSHTISGGYQMKEGMVNWSFHLDGAAFCLQYWGGEFSFDSFHTNTVQNCVVLDHDNVADELTAFFLEHSTPLNTN